MYASNIHTSSNTPDRVTAMIGAEEVEPRRAIFTICHAAAIKDV